MAKEFEKTEIPIMISDPEPVKTPFMNRIKKWVENFIFASKWLLIPFYLKLFYTLILLLYDFVVHGHLSNEIHYIMTKQHLLIVIDKDKNIPPKKYSIELEKMNKSRFITWAKAIYEQNHKNPHYETYYFEHSV